MHIDGVDCNYYLCMLGAASLKFPVIVILDRLNGPVELLSKSLREKLFNGDLEFLCEDDCETGVDVVLSAVSLKYHKTDT